MIVADESTDYNIVKKLREAKFEVLAIHDKHAGSPDDLVLNLAYESKAFLITEDNDFGELIHRFQAPHHGVLLVRINKSKHPDKAEFVFQLVSSRLDELRGKFSVLTATKLRISS